MVRSLDPGGGTFPHCVPVGQVHSITVLGDDHGVTILGDDHGVTFHSSDRDATVIGLKLVRLHVLGQFRRCMGGWCPVHRRPARDVGDPDPWPLGHP
ncbi:hypothetical protein SAMN05216199_1040 [Pedococcus cremeus]|uniref:Uncharacterized protein n=1 Tax=Pedococcus cremeus TaxID=587636 RepID=A0A1H9RM20_9MICO|nr:hypothetical protein SAMN05216199_1040 [Pedococcus cremeus]